MRPAQWVVAAALGTALFAQTAADRERVKAEWAKTHPARQSTGFVPLTELGRQSYKGEQGGLYPGGENVPPASHAAAGKRLARSIRPLNGEGRESPDGKIVMVSVGMSNTMIESQVFAKMLEGQAGIHPRFLFVDCAQGGQVVRVTANPDAKYWEVAEQRLHAAGATPAQVQVAWIKQASAGPTAAFPAAVKILQAGLAGTAQTLHRKYPNLKIAYLSSRIYAGYSISPLNPEPHAYEGAFAVKWLIAAQMAGDPELNYDSAKGPVKAPWLAWGPYLWADGVKPRGDGLTWVLDDFVESDRTHPSPAGREKVARQLLEFLKRDPSATPWFTAASQ